MRLKQFGWITLTLRSALLLLLAAALVSAGCSKQPPPAEPSVAAGKSVDWWLSHLTLEEKVGQLFWFGLGDVTLSPEAEQLIKEGRTGGFIFFARQGSNPESLRALTGRMQALSQSRERLAPGLVITIDHEGGRVQRWTEPFTTWPGNMAIGATRSPAYAEQVAAAMADELVAVGLTMNLSPVADVNNNPANPVIGVRSFGEEPDLVARLVQASIRGTQSRQVSAVAKHFPGHGDTSLDSHKALPVIPHAMDRLERVELPPFRAAIQADVDAIMSAHVIFPAVEPEGLPATLSARALSDLLKGKLGFPGLVVTDAMDSMKAITDNYGLEKGLVKAVQAGADVVLVTDSFGRQSALHDLLVQAVKNREITMDRLNDAVRRQLNLKARRGLLPDTGANAGKQGLSALANKGAVGTADHRRLSLQVGADALTLVRNKHLPLNLGPDQQVLVIGPSYSAAAPADSGVGTALGAGILAYHKNVREIQLEMRPKASALDAVRTAAARASVIVYGVYNGHSYPEHAALIRELIARGKPVIVVGMGEPYELTKIPEIQTYIAAYGYQTPNLQGVGGLLFGKAPPKGKLPVSIPGLYPFGHGLSY